MSELPEVLVQVGKSIRQIRLSKGLSQQRLAEKCGFTFSYIGGVERAEKNISLKNLDKIAAALEVGIHQFFSYTPRYEKLTTSEQIIHDISALLATYDEQTLLMAKDILSDVVKHTRPQA